MGPWSQMAVISRKPTLMDRDKKIYPTDIVRCNYLSMPFIPASGRHTQVLLYYEYFIYCTVVYYVFSIVFDHMHARRGLALTSSES